MFLSRTCIHGRLPGLTVIAPALLFPHTKPFNASLPSLFHIALLPLKRLISAGYSISNVHPENKHMKNNLGGGAPNECG